MGMFDFIKPLAGKAVGTTFGKMATAGVIMGAAGIGWVKLYQDPTTGDVIGAELLEKKNVAKGDKGGNVLMNLEGLQEKPQDNPKTPEGLQKGADEQGKEDAIEKLRQQQESGDPATLAEKQGQEQGQEQNVENPADEDQNPADEEQNLDGFKDENGDKGDNESGENKKGPDTYKDNDGVTDEQQEGGEDENKEEENKNKDEDENKEENKEEGGQEGGEENKEGKDKENKEGEDNKKEVKKEEGGVEGNKEGEGKKEVEDKENKEEEVEDKKEEEVAEVEENQVQTGGTLNNNNNNNVDNNNSTTVEKETPGENVGGGFNNNNMNVASGASNVSPMDILERAAKDGRMIHEDELKAVREDFVKVVAKVVYEAAKSGAREIGFVTDRVKDVLDGIRSGFSRIAQKQIWPEYDGVFSVKLSFSESYLSDFASSCNLSDYEVSVASEEYNSSRIDLKRKIEEQAVTPEDDGWKAARSRFIHQLKYFSQEHLSVCQSHYIEKAGTSYDPGLTWLVRTAGCGGDPRKGDELVLSAVRRLTISLQPKPEQREDMLRYIAFGVNELLQEEGLGLKNGFLKINVPFAQGKSAWVNPQGGQKISYYKDGDNRFDVEYLKNGDLLLHSKDLRGIVAKRFEKGGDHVWEEEVDLLGLEDVLYLAARPESKVKTLYLRTGSGNEPFFVRGHEKVREQLEEALKGICGMEKINAGLRIATNLRWEDGVADWEDELNASSSRNAVMFGGSGGTISFVVGGRWSTQAVKDAKDKWNNDGSKDSVLAEFKKQNGDVNWDKVVEYALGESDSPWLYFRQAGLQTESIGWAAESDSKVDKLILNEAPWGGLLREIKNVVERETIHGFTLSVRIKEVDKDIPPEEFLKNLQRRKWWKNRKHDLKFENGLFVFVSKTSSGSSATKPPTTGGAGAPGAGAGEPASGAPTGTAGTGSADAGKIVQAAQAGGVSELEIKSYSDEDALISEILDVLERNTEIHEFALKGNGIDNALLEKITKDARYAGCSHNLCKFQYDGTKTGLYFMNGIYDDLGKTDTAKLKDLREKLKTVGEDRGFGFVSMGFTLPTVFPYDSCNDTKAGFQGVLDNWIVTDVLDYDECPKEVKDELDKDKGKGSDLILEATCFYNPNLYADSQAKAAGVTGTRNYFLHSWLADDLNYRGGRKGHKVEINLSATTKIIEPHGIINRADFDGRKHSVSFHDGDAYSPNNFIFQIERNGADAWFVSSYTSKGGSMRRIVIHWTFIQDDDGSKFVAEDAKRSSNQLSILPCQFSPNPDERSMEVVKVYLRLKKKQKKAKEKAEAKKEAAAKKKEAAKKAKEGEVTKKQEAAKKKKEVLQKLGDAVRDGNRFHLNEAKNEGVPLEEVLEKANELGDAQLSLEGLPPAALGNAFVDLEEAFKKCFAAGRFNSKLKWSIFADLDDVSAGAFQNRLNKFFCNSNVADIFVNLDKRNNRIFFSDKDECGKEEPLPQLQVDDKGKLQWTVELERWWRNPANKVKTFAVALAQTPELAEVDFAELFKFRSDPAADLFEVVVDGYDTDEWKAFRKDKDLHRYRNDVAAFYGCSGVKFTFVPGEKDDAFKTAIEVAGFYNTGLGDWDQSTWSVVVANKCRAVEDNGKYRLLWNNRAMELLEAAKNAGAGSDDALKAFAREVGEAETLDGTPLIVDFTFNNYDNDFDILSEASGQEGLWDALQVQFGKDDSCTFICPEDIKDVVDISGADLPNVLKNKGWQVKYDTGRSIFEVTGKKDDSAPGAGAGTGDGTPGAGTGEPLMPNTIPWAVAGLVTREDSPKVLKREEHSEYLYLNSTLDEFLDAVSKKLSSVRQIGFRLGAKADLTVLLKYPGWTFTVRGDNTSCTVEAIRQKGTEGRVRIDDESITGKADQYVTFTVL